MVANGTGGPGFAVPAMVAVHAEKQGAQYCSDRGDPAQHPSIKPQTGVCAWGLRKGVVMRSAAYPADRLGW